MEESISLELPTQLKDFNDDLLDEAIHFVLSSARASVSAVQRRFSIGYNRAASLIEAMEARGIVSKMAENGARVVIADNSTNVVLSLVDKENSQLQLNEQPVAKCFLDRITQTRKVYVDSIDLSEIPQNWLCRCVVHNAIVKKEYPIQLWSTAQENNALQISWQQAQALLYRSLIDYSVEGLINIEEEDIGFLFKDKPNLVVFGFFIKSGNDQISENIKQFIALIKAQQIAPIQMMMIYVIAGNHLMTEDYEQVVKAIEPLLSEDSMVKIGLAFDEALDDKSEIKVIFCYI